MINIIIYRALVFFIDFLPVGLGGHYTSTCSLQHVEWEGGHNLLPCAAGDVQPVSCFANSALN